MENNSVHTAACRPAPVQLTRSQQSTYEKLQLGLLRPGALIAMKEAISRLTKSEEIAERMEKRAELLQFARETGLLEYRANAEVLARTSRQVLPAAVSPAAPTPAVVKRPAPRISRYEAVVLACIASAVEKRDGRQLVPGAEQLWSKHSGDKTLEWWPKFATQIHTIYRKLRRPEIGALVYSIPDAPASPGVLTKKGQALAQAAKEFLEEDDTSGAMDLHGRPIPAIARRLPGNNKGQNSHAPAAGLVRRELIIPASASGSAARVVQFDPHCMPSAIRRAVARVYGTTVAALMQRGQASTPALTQARRMVQTLLAVLCGWADAELAKTFGIKITSVGEIRGQFQQEVRENFREARAKLEQVLEQLRTTA